MEIFMRRLKYDESFVNFFGQNNDDYEFRSLCNKTNN